MTIVNLQVVRVAVFAEGSAADEARAAGADIVGGDELIEQIKNGLLLIAIYYFICVMIINSLCNDHKFVDHERDVSLVSYLSWS